MPHRNKPTPQFTATPAQNLQQLCTLTVWLQVLRGAVKVNGTLLETSDGLALSDETSLTIVGERSAEVMLFDLA